MSAKVAKETVTQGQVYLPHGKRFEMNGGKFVHPAEHILLSEIVDLKGEVRHLRNAGVVKSTALVDESKLGLVLDRVEEIQRKRMLNEKNIRSEETLLQYSVDFFIEPSNLDGIPNDSRAVEIADKMLYGNNPAIHRTKPRLVGEVAKVTEVQVI